jgi:hypothetical protein
MLCPAVSGVFWGKIKNENLLDQREPTPDIGENAAWHAKPLLSFKIRNARRNS